MKQGAFTAFRSGKLTYPRHSRLGTDKVYVCFFGAAPGPFLSHFVKRGLAKWQPVAPSRSLESPTARFYANWNITHCGAIDREYWSLGRKLKRILWNGCREEWLSNSNVRPKDSEWRGSSCRSSSLSLRSALSDSLEILQILSVIMMILSRLIIPFARILSKGGGGVEILR